MAQYYKQKIRLKDSDGQQYILRRKEITSVAFYYRSVEQSDNVQFTLVTDFNIDEVDNSLWFTLPTGTYTWYCVVSVKPLRTIQTALQTTDFTIGKPVIEAFATPCPLEALQGHSPYLDPNTLTWFQYSDENQCYYDTNIKASGIIDPTAPIDHPIVDYIQSGVMSAVTSNAVAGLRTEINLNVSETNQRLINLESKRISVKLNGETHQEDDNGTVDLGSIDGGSVKDLRMLEDETTLPDGTIVPRGTVVDTEDKIFSLSSPHQFYKQNYTQNGWMFVCALNGNCQLNVRYNVYNNSVGGTIFISREGYDYKAVTTNEMLGAQFKIYQKGLSAFLVTQGQMYVSKYAHYEVVDGNPQFKNYPSPISDYNIQQGHLYDIDVFMTSYTERDEWITISENSYETEAEGLEYFKYNLDTTGEVNFQFTDNLEEPTVLTFVALHDGTSVKVTDADGNWAAISQDMQQGDMAILTWVSPTEYSWSYTTKKEYEITANKVNEITSANSGSTYLYPSLKALTTWVGNNGGKVKSVTINNEKVEPDDTTGDINLGDVITPDYNVWVTSKYDKVNKTAVNEQFSMTELGTDALGKAIASSNFVEQYVEAKTVRTIYLNDQPNIADFGDPTTINLGVMKVKANGSLYAFNTDNVCDLGNIGGQIGDPLNLENGQASMAVQMKGLEASCSAIGAYSLAVGSLNQSIGENSIAGGEHTVTNGKNSLGVGYYLLTYNDGEVAFGRNNISRTGNTTGDKTLLSLGNGVSSKRNAFEVRENGDVYIWLGGNYVKLQDSFGDAVSFDADNQKLSIGSDTYQLVRGIQTESSMYKNPERNGYIKMPIKKVKINGVEKSFSAKTGTSYPTEVCDLGNCISNVQLNGKDVYVDDKGVAQMDAVNFVTCNGIKAFSRVNSYGERYNDIMDSLNYLHVYDFNSGIVDITKSDKTKGPWDTANNISFGGYVVLNCSYVRFETQKVIDYGLISKRWELFMQHAAPIMVDNTVVYTAQVGDKIDIFWENRKNYASDNHYNLIIIVNGSNMVHCAKYIQ